MRVGGLLQRAEESKRKMIWFGGEEQVKVTGSCWENSPRWSATTETLIFKIASISLVLFSHALLSFSPLQNSVSCTSPKSVFTQGLAALMHLYGTSRNVLLVIGIEVRAHILTVMTALAFPPHKAIGRSNTITFWMTSDTRLFSFRMHSMELRDLSIEFHESVKRAPPWFMNPITAQLHVQTFLSLFNSLAEWYKRWCGSRGDTSGISQGSKPIRFESVYRMVLKEYFPFPEESFSLFNRSIKTLGKTPPPTGVSKLTYATDVYCFI